MAAKEAQQRPVDLWLVIVILVGILAIGGGLWMSWKSLDTRIHEVSKRLRAQSEQTQSAVLDLHKQVQALTAVAQKGTICAQNPGRDKRSRRPKKSIFVVKAKPSP